MTTFVKPGDLAICVHAPNNGKGSLVHYNLGAICSVIRLHATGQGWTSWEVQALSQWIVTHSRDRSIEITASAGDKIVVMDHCLRPLKYEMGLDETLQWSGYPPSPKLELDADKVRFNSNRIVDSLNDPWPGRPLSQFSDKALRAIGKRLGFDPKL